MNHGSLGDPSGAGKGEGDIKGVPPYAPASLLIHPPPKGGSKRTTTTLMINTKEKKTRNY